MAKFGKGDRVYSKSYEDKGTVTGINLYIDDEDEYPVNVKFDGGQADTFTLDGRLSTEYKAIDLESLEYDKLLDEVSSQLLEEYRELKTRFYNIAIKYGFTPNDIYFSGEMEELC